jgi:glc operon protein GlcG
MKIRIGLLAMITATAFAGTAVAAASLGDVIQKGAAADKVMEKNQINFATAKALGDHCLNEATAKNMGVSVVIVDQFGTIVYYVRGDGQGKTNTESALWKARTVLNTRAPSKAQMNAVRSGNVNEARVIWQGNFANAGGLPIVVDGQFLGAIGVGGMAATPPTWSDEVCGYNALTAVLGPQPKLLPDMPNPFVVKSAATN